MVKEKKEKIRYRSYSFPLDKRTVELLRKLKRASGISWNRFFNDLILKKDEQIKK